LYPRSTCGGFEVPFGRSLPKSGRDRPQGHFPESTTEKPRRREQSLSGGHSAALVTAFKTTIEERHGKARMPCVVLIGAPQKAGERIGDDLFSRDEKTKAASASAYALPAKSAGSA
jgi:hypothetical protein